MNVHLFLLWNMILTGLGVASNLWKTLTQRNVADRIGAGAALVIGAGFLWWAYACLPYAPVN